MLSASRPQAEDESRGLVQCLDGTAERAQSPRKETMNTTVANEERVITTEMRKLEFRTRWPIKQSGRNSFVVEVPLDGDEPILNSRAVEALGLSPKEYEAATAAALRAVAIVS